MIDAHEVVDYLKDHFDQEDMQIVLLLSQGAKIMKKCHQAARKNGYANIPGFDDNLTQKLEKIDAYLLDVIEEELHDRLREIPGAWQAERDIKESRSLFTGL